MKKNILKIFILVLITLSVAACRKDLGNYDYQAINDGTISEMQGSYTSLQGARLVINPKLTLTQDQSGDTSKYSYEWFYIDNTSLPLTKRPIAKTKNLDWVVSIPSLSTAYDLWYVVTEKSTGLAFRKSAKLNVTSNIADGWLVLNDINGGARLDFYNYLTTTGSYQYYNDILSSNSTLKLVGKPKLVYYAYRRDPFTSVIAKSIFVSTDQGTFIINTQNNSFGTYTNFTNSMANYVPPPYYAEKIKAQASSYLEYMLDSKGQLFFENATQLAAFGTRVNKLSNGQDINISKYFAEAYGSITTYALMYDVDNQRFLEHKAMNSSSAVPTTTSTLFDPANVGMELLYMDSTPALNGQTFALFKNNSNKMFLARIICNSTSFNPQAFDEITTAPELLNASQFAIDPSEGYIMYTVGPKVYRYNPFDKTNTMILDLGTRKISLLKYQKMVFSRTNTRYAEYAKKLVICSYDEASPNTSGKMELYNVPTLNGAVSMYQTFDGFGKIVDVSYRE